MITTTTDGKTFVLTGQSEQDFALIDALDLDGRHLRFTGTGRTRAQTAGFVNISATLRVDPDSAESLRADTGREVVRAFSQLIRLGLREAALHGHVSTDAADPQAQEQFAASLEQFQLMLQAFGSVVVQQEAVLQKMRRAHGDAFEVVLPIVPNGGAA